MVWGAQAGKEECGGPVVPTPGAANATDRSVVWPPREQEVGASPWLQSVQRGGRLNDPQQSK